MEQSAIISLYKSEIETYKEQIDALKSKNEITDRKNASLNDKVRQLENLVEKANVANQDLHTAFNHVTEENLRLKLQAKDQPEATPIVADNDIKALETVQEQYADLVRESVSWISVKEQLNQKIKFLERECARYHRDNTTLGKQVRHLLRTLEEERGMIIRHHNELTQDEQMTCAADVIDKHLITFESVEELQQQNQKIVSLLKDMSAREEERESQIQSDEVDRLMLEIGELKKQLSNVEGERTRILDALNTIHKERELFKILLSKTRQVEHMTPEIFQRMISIACSSSASLAAGAIDSTSASENEAHINDLKAMISKLEQELANTKAELFDLRKRSQEEIQLKAELLERAHKKIIEETQRADVLNERNEVLDGNLKKILLEFDEMRTKCQKMTFETDILKEQIDTLKNLQEELKDLQIKHQKLTCETDYLKSQVDEKKSLQMELDETKANYQRISFEAEMLKNQLNEMKVLQVELKESQTNCQRMTFEIDHLKGQIADTKRLQVELDEARSKCQKILVEADQYKNQMNDTSGLQVELDEARVSLQQMKDEVDLLRSRLVEMDRLRDEFEKLRDKFEKAQNDIVQFQLLRNVEREQRLLAEMRCRRKKPMTRIDKIDKPEPAKPISDPIPEIDIPQQEPTKVDQPAPANIQPLGFTLKRRNIT